MELSSNEVASIHQALSGKPKDAKIVVAFSDVRAYEKKFRIFPEIRQQYPHARLLSLNYFLSKHLDENKIGHDRVCRGEMLKEYAGIFEPPVTYAQEWFKHRDTGSDFTEYNGLSLGTCLQLHSVHFFQAVLKCAIDVAVYFQSNIPDVLIHVHSGRYPQEAPSPHFHFDIFYDLLPFMCRKKKIEFFSVECPASRVAGILQTAWEKIKPGPPIDLGGFKIRLPQPLFLILKNLFLFAKNRIARKYYDPQKRNILFASATAASYFGQPALKTFSENEGFNIFVLNGESRQRKVINILPFFSPRFLALGVKKILLKNKFRKQLHADQEDLKRSTQFQGSSLFELYPFYFEDIYLNHFPELIAQTEFLKSCLAKNKIATVITQSDAPAHERVTVLTANACSIPTIHLQHGYEIGYAGKTIGFPRVARYQFVWGNIHATILGEKTNKDQIRITGYTNLDSLNPPEETSWPDMGRPGTMVLIMHSASQYLADCNLTFEENELLVKMSLEMIQGFPAKTLVIKLRPNDIQAGIYQKLIDRSGLKNARIETGSLIPILKPCDLYLHVYSTGALEGMALNKPGIRFGFILNNKKLYMEKVGVRNPFEEYEGEVRVDRTTAECLISAVQSIYESREPRGKWLAERTRFLEDYINYGKGDPVENFMNLVKETLEDKQPSTTTGNATTTY